MASGQNRVRNVAETIINKRIAKIAVSWTAETPVHTITPVASVRSVFPRTFELFDDAAIAEGAVVVRNKSLACNVETHRSSFRRVVGILNKFVRQRAVTLEVSELRAEIPQSRTLG